MHQMTDLGVMGAKDPLDAYPSDPLLSGTGMRYQQLNSISRGASSLEPIVSGAGHDALAMAAITKVCAQF